MCAIVLCVTPVAAQAAGAGDPASRLARHVQTMKKDRAVLAFFDSHRWLLTDPRFEVEAARQLKLHRRSLAAALKKVAATRDALAQHKPKRANRKLQGLVSATPQATICQVFGSDCDRALRVSRCESNLQTTAQNGQYLGLFQMGTSERRLFGHGPSALEQVKAAYRYYVASGRDWSPWSCKPW